MFVALGEFVFGRTNAWSTASDRLMFVDEVGTKACGLCLLPMEWTPPFLVVATSLYLRWCETELAQRATLLQIELRKLEKHMTGWSEQWPAGLAFRSSARSETLRDRGAYQSVELTADYGIDQMCGALTRIYSSFANVGGSNAIAVVVQARVHNQMRGHLSNERRVSKTVNHWMWEVEAPEERDGRFNSQRVCPPSESEILRVRSGSEAALIALFRRVGRWCTNLRVGTVHLEWGAAADVLWLFQLDVEEDQGDEGIDPRKLLRVVDTLPSAPPPKGSPFEEADYRKLTSWKKINNACEFLVDNDRPYPRLYYATGAEIAEATQNGRDITADIEEMTRGHAVCRTDCNSEKIGRLNLPRTDTVSAANAADFISRTLDEMRSRGAADSEICFIIHKFLPATVAAWARSGPQKQVVLVDALWGLPDGLQYLSHDTFEYDIRRCKLSSETLRYKPVILQEVETGEWKLTRVARNLARNRCLPMRDIRQVAEVTHQIATRLGKAIQIMWFCDVDERAGVGRNVPWFMLDAPLAMSHPKSLAPGLPRRAIQTEADLSNLPAGRFVLDLEPEANLFRDEGFLDRIAEIALSSDLPVVMRGSVLGHAYYTLERRGVSVVATESVRTRARQRQVFKKLVRDEIPNQILERGEKVIVAKIAKSESRAALVVKLYEESQELLAAQTPADVTAELADVLEVVRSLCLATGIDVEEVERTADAKRGSRGSFVRNVVLLETSWPGWKEKPVESNEATISLRELGQVTRLGKRHLINFAAAVSAGGGLVELGNGTQIAIRMAEKGIEVEEIKSLGVGESQLSFAL